MITFLIVIHTLICVLLVIVILMQSGRGGGLTEQFSSAESVFGAKTNIVMVRITSVLATIFIVTSVSLAYLSAKREQSLMGQRKMSIPKQTIEIPIQKDFGQTVNELEKESGKAALDIKASATTPATAVPPAK